MLRTALRPALLGLLAIMLAAAALFAFLGHWQLDRAHEHAKPSRTERVVDLSSVLRPAAPFTGDADHQRVRVSGTWVAQDTVLVARHLDGRAGSSVVTALRVGGRSAPGALLPVVRGWVPAGRDDSAGAVPAPPAGVVELTGRLLVSEDPQGVQGGRVSAISSADLLNVWGSRLFTGYLVTDAAVPAGAGLSAVPAPPPSQRLNLQNLSYAFQWWLFAGFAVVLWGKIVRDRHAADLEALEDGEDGEGEDAADELVAGAVGRSCEDGGSDRGSRGGTHPAGAHPDSTHPDSTHPDDAIRQEVSPVSSVQQRPSGRPASPRRRDPGASLTRYRVMALVTGTMLLLLTVEVIVNYLIHPTGALGAVVASAHGWIYVVYLVTVADLWSKLRWPLLRLVVLVLCGVVPFLSFWAERRVVAEVRAGRTGPDVPATPPAPGHAA